MAHALWCGKECCYCENTCWVDECIPCSPDCENLRSDGIPDPEKCKDCEDYKIIVEEDE